MLQLASVSQMCTYDEIFDFDFTDDLENETILSSSPTSSLEGNDHHSLTSLKPAGKAKQAIHPVKAVRGSQFMKKNTSNALTIKTTSTQAGTWRSKPNVSKCNPTNILYAFPNFDKSDSLIYFPHSMTRFMNTGDTEGFKKLLMSHADRKCEAILQANLPPLSPRLLLGLSEIMHEARPDMIMCVRTTQVVDHQIRACAYWKYTDIQSVYDTVVNSISDPILKNMFSCKRSRRMRTHLECESKQRTPEEQNELIDFVDSKANVLAYGVVDITLTIDPITKKITQLGFVNRLTSVHPID